MALRPRFDELMELIRSPRVEFEEEPTVKVIAEVPVVALPTVRVILSPTEKLEAPVPPVRAVDRVKTVELLPVTTASEAVSTVWSACLAADWADFTRLVRLSMPLEAACRVWTELEMPSRRFDRSPARSESEADVK